MLRKVEAYWFEISIVVESLEPYQYIGSWTAEFEFEFRNWVQPKGSSTRLVGGAWPLF